MIKIYKNILIFLFRTLQKLFLKFSLCISVTRASHSADQRRILQKLRAAPSTFRFTRIGGNSDGGYVVPHLDTPPSFCISPGVGPVSDLEAQFDSLGVPVLMLDASVDGPARPMDKAIFLKKFLGPVSAENYITLDDCMTIVDSHFGKQECKNGLLQMDIEGAEYDCLLGCPSTTLQRFNVILLELHHLDKYLLSSACCTLEAVIEKLRADFEIVHLHANNCCGVFNVGGVDVPRVMEMTLVRKDFIKETGDEVTIGGGRILDKRCVANNDEIHLDDWFFMYSERSS
jgi:hypothetical protein